jgi:cell division protein FtsI/penicillin-binding protein 2
MIRAVAAIANDGVLTTPQVVDKILGYDWREDIRPILGEKVISPDSANEMTAMMVEAAKSGEAKWTHARGFKVAGKTGTAQIPIAGHYDDEKTIASFVGFVPADDPKFVMLVTLREPSSSPWASETAAPLWYTIAKEFFVFFGIQPEN